MPTNSRGKNNSPGPLSSLALIAILVLLPTSALAYLDPGTGSFIFQGIIAGIVGLGLAVKLFWHRIRALFTGKSVPEDDDADV